jgi:2-polyprenyl-3-methyl-5-hydroxy-6-metoxy-1,4-benzoquinol methylase
MVMIGDKLEVSGFSPLPVLHFFKKKVNYEKDTNVISQDNFFLFDESRQTFTRRYSDFSKFDIQKLTPNCVDTKEYWNFLHENFPFCDVASHFCVTNLNSYFNVKGKAYDAIISELGIDFFKNKKILEIGPGYGYLPKLLNDNNIKHTYYCADIVHRFNHDNFIDVNGYTLSDITDKFDVIIMVDVIQHLNVEILHEYCANIKNLLNFKGSFIIGTEMKSQEDFIGSFFGQMYNTMGLKSILKRMSDLGFSEKPRKIYKLNNYPYGMVLEFIIKDTRN